MRCTVGCMILGAVLQVSVSGAWAQAPVPLQRSMALYEPLQAKVAEDVSTSQQTAPVPPKALSTSAPRSAPSMANKDRFGNVVRGTTCAEHWANCAYDPTRPRQ